MKICQILLITIMGCLLVFPLFAETGQAGGAEAYLKLGAGARAVGMGNAYTGIADDVNATYWNPAGLINLEHTEASTMRSNLSLDRRYNYFTIGRPGMNGVWGVSWTNAGVDSIERRDANGVLGGYFEDSQHAFAFSYAMKASEKLSLGSSVKYLTHKLDHNSADSFAADLGLLYDLASNFSVGLAIKEIGAEMQWDTASGRKDSVPVNTTLGFGWKPVKNVIMALDLNKVEDMDVKVNFGVEGKLHKLLTLRAGVNDGEVTGGIGLHMQDWNFDYAYNDHDLGDMHRLSATIRWDYLNEETSEKPEKKIIRRKKPVKKEMVKAIHKPEIKEEKNDAIGGLLKQIQPAKPADTMALLESQADQLCSDGNYTKAMEMYKNIHAQIPENGEICYKIANLFIMNKDKENAVEFYKKGLELNPESKYAKYAKVFVPSK